MAALGTMADPLPRVASEEDLPVSESAATHRSFEPAPPPPPDGKTPPRPRSEKSDKPDSVAIPAEAGLTKPKEREERQDRATRCFSAFLASLSTLLGYEINPWLGWSWMVCLAVIYAYTEVVS